MRLRQKYKNAKKEIERLQKIINSPIVYRIKTAKPVKCEVSYIAPDDFYPREYAERILAEKFLPVIFENMKVDVDYYSEFTNHPVYRATIMLFNSNDI